MPDSITNGLNYQMQFGRRYSFGISGGAVVTATRFVNQSYDGATMDALVTNVGAGGILGVQVTLGNATIYSTISTITNPTTIALPDFVGALNSYIGSQPYASTIDVSVGVTLTGQADVILTNLIVTSTSGIDLSVSPGDVVFGASNAVEGDAVPITLTLHNGGAQDSGALIAAFYATQTVGISPTAFYIGSAFVPNVPANSTAQASISWNTLGYTGSVPLRAVVDPYNRVAETSEANNQVSGALTVLTRPDLQVTALTLSDPEPVVSETVTATLVVRNFGQTTAPGSVLALYNGNPDSGGLLLGAQTLSALAAGASVTTTFGWTPTATGSVRLFARADRDGQVSDSNRANNDLWLDAFVGFRGPILLDSGGATDPAYTAALGYGYLDEGGADVAVTCAFSSTINMRQDPGGRVVYRFDNLLPGHAYHLDLTLMECDQNLRQETVSVDGIQVAGPVDLGDQQAHALSLRLDPALYADHTISVTVESTTGSGALVAEADLYDVDYRYADSGGANDLAYPNTGARLGRTFGYLDPSVTLTGTLPYQSARVDQQDNDLLYRYDGLDPAKLYQIQLSFWQASGPSRIEKVQVDGQDTGTSVTINSGALVTTTISVPQASYQDDSSITVGIVRLDAPTGALVSEIALEELTVTATVGCSVPATPYKTILDGGITLNGAPAPAGTLVTALNPRGNIVGCVFVRTPGSYGFMNVYGEDSGANPLIPGMRAGEIVEFHVNGALSVAKPSLYWQNDLAEHVIGLTAGPIEAQSLILAPQWNLVSTKQEPPVPTVGRTLQTINGQYCRVFGETGIYDCTLADVYQTLKELHAGLSYYVNITSPTTVNLLAQGLTLPPTTSLALHTGWNWVGYWPTATLPISQALQSIDGNYDFVLSLNQTYKPTDPVHSDLLQMGPGLGYQIHVSVPVTLTYPLGAGGAGGTAPQPASVTCAGVSPTPYRTLVYGQLLGNPVPAGATVQVLTPRGDVAGCATVRQAGQYGFIQVYGEDAAIPGFRAGEPLRFRVNGLDAAAANSVPWQNDLSPHAIDLTAGGYTLYLPIVARSGTPQ
ncbi:MAG: hypothetical protein HYR71_08925 [Chloroflexi bacterium]|nr:hypothetical protein [Chloroflexota bacterium]